jgi:hypothetical protein
VDLKAMQAHEVAQAAMGKLTPTTGWIIPVDGGKLVG